MERLVTRRGVGADEERRKVCKGALGFLMFFLVPGLLSCESDQSNAASTETRPTLDRDEQASMNASISTALNGYATRVAESGHFNLALDRKSGRPKGGGLVIQAPVAKDQRLSGYDRGEYGIAFVGNMGNIVESGKPLPWTVTGFGIIETAFKADDPNNTVMLANIQFSRINEGNWQVVVFEPGSEGLTVDTSAPQTTNQKAVTDLLDQVNDTLNGALGSPPAPVGIAPTFKP